MCYLFDLKWGVSHGKKIKMTWPWLLFNIYSQQYTPFQRVPIWFSRVSCRYKFCWSVSLSSCSSWSTCWGSILACDLGECYPTVFYSKEGLLVDVYLGFKCWFSVHRIKLCHLVWGWAWWVSHSLQWTLMKYLLSMGFCDTSVLGFKKW